jgi:hypothetical protein
MTLTFFAGYDIARFLREVGVPGFRAITENPVISLATDSLYAAIAIHITAGIVWALVYAYFVEPNLQGSWWQKSMGFSLILWALSLVVFMPLVGAGFFGMSIGAGPLPALVSLGLHLVYGFTLGFLYRPSEVMNLVDGASRRTTSFVEGTTAGGIAIGAIVGLVAGSIAMATLPSLDTFGVSPWFFPVIGTLTGGGLGILIGSMAGLSSTDQQRFHSPEEAEAQARSESASR